MLVKGFMDDTEGWGSTLAYTVCRSDEKHGFTAVFSNLPGPSKRPLKNQICEFSFSYLTHCT